MKKPASNGQLTLPCPAKLNLFLHILGRRPDGYHELQTVFQLLDFGDELRVTASDDKEIILSCDMKGLAEGIKLDTADNLVHRAAALLQQKLDQHGHPPKGAKLHLTKHLPAGGGIGGGSSDAATTLLALNHLWQTGFSLDELADLGATLGADVPVFIRGRSAWAEGVGEKIEALNLSNRWYVVLAPNCAVSTASVFTHKDLTRDSMAITVRAFLKEGGRNDCQPLVESLYPEVKEAVTWLSSHGRAQLTGTGACVFAAMSSQTEAQDVFANRPAHIGGFVAKGVNTSPLHKSLSNRA